MFNGKYVFKGSIFHCYVSGSVYRLVKHYHYRMVSESFHQQGSTKAPGYEMYGKTPHASAVVFSIRILGKQGR